MDMVAISLAVYAGYLGAGLLLTRSISRVLLLLGIPLVYVWHRLDPDIILIEQFSNQIKQQTSVLVLLGFAALILTVLNVTWRRFRSFDRIFINLAILGIILGNIVFHHVMFFNLLPAWREESSFLNEYVIDQDDSIFMRNCAKAGFRCATVDQKLVFSALTEKNIERDVSQIHGFISQQAEGPLYHYFGGFSTFRGEVPYFASYTIDEQQNTFVIADVNSARVAKKTLETGFFILSFAVNAVWLFGALLLCHVHNKRACR